MYWPGRNVVDDATTSARSRTCQPSPPTPSRCRACPPGEQGTAWRPVARIVTARRQLEGEGFQVRRPFPRVDFPLADPFLLLDHLGAVEYAPGEAKGAPWHPHRGFETVTYIIDGAFEHHDSTGGGGLITDGATQWMTAGAGILHDEMPTESCSSQGRPVPRRAALGEPARAAEDGRRRATRTSRADNVVMLSVRRRRRAGPADRRRARRARRARRHVDADHLRARHVSAGARLQLPWPADFNALVYVLSGRGTVGTDGAAIARASSPCSATATR